MHIFTNFFSLQVINPISTVNPKIYRPYQLIYLKYFVESFGSQVINPLPRYLSTINL
jgi:hypothetical protein